VAVRVDEDGLEGRARPRGDRGAIRPSHLRV
jgi:hypothetical protein